MGIASPSESHGAVCSGSKHNTLREKASNLTPGAFIPACRIKLVGWDTGGYSAPPPTIALHWHQDFVLSSAPLRAAQNSPLQPILRRRPAAPTPRHLRSCL